MTSGAIENRNTANRAKPFASPAVDLVQRPSELGGPMGGSGKRRWASANRTSASGEPPSGLDSQTQPSDNQTQESDRRRSGLENPWELRVKAPDPEDSL